VVFPGQGSQARDMRSAVRASRPELLELAAELAGADPFDHLDDGTAFLQPAIFCASVASWQGIAGRVPAGAAFAGHSLGELSALTCAGALSAEDGLRLVGARGAAMQRAAEHEAGGAMLALGAGVEEARELADAHGVAVANDNSPGQTVLSGPADGIASACDDAHARGLRAIELPIRGAFHTQALHRAAAEFDAAFAGVTLRAPERPVVSCTTARPFDDVRAELVGAVTAGVRWRETVATLAGAGVRSFVEVGPGRVLTGLIKRTLSGATAQTAERAFGPANRREVTA
jgi:malonyl CoA-acyl carrier protein transacylase